MSLVSNLLTLLTKVMELVTVLEATQRKQCFPPKLLKILIKPIIFAQPHPAYYNDYVIYNTLCVQINGPIVAPRFLGTFPLCSVGEDGVIC